MRKFRKIILFDIDDTLFDTATFKETNFETFSIFDDIFPVLAKLTGIAELGIFSQGDSDLQRKKLQKTNIENFFNREHIYIVQDKISMAKDILKKYSEDEKIFFVEDRLPSLHAVKKFFPSIYTIWMKRGRYAHSQKPIEDFLPDAVVGNLGEIIPIIQS